MKSEIRDKKNLDKYLQQMVELKARLAHLKVLMISKGDRFSAESSALHIRKIIELFAFSLMSLQKDAYREFRNLAGADFIKDWNGRDILNNLAKLYPDLLFRPIEKEVGIQPDGTKNIVFMKEVEVYTVKRLNKLYERCGGVLHVSNPWKKL
jgi:hypothetical protein